MPYRITEFTRRDGGNVAVIFGVLAPMLLALVGAGVDYGRYYSIRTAFQEAADMAALAGVRQFTLSTSTQLGGDLPKAVAKAAADKFLRNHPYGSTASAKASADPSEPSVTVEIAGAFTPTFLVGMFKNPVTLDVEATATAGESAKTCVIVTNETDAAVLIGDDNAKLFGNGCSIYVNSTSTASMKLQSHSEINANFLCTAGGIFGSKKGYAPAPLTDCPVKEDPITFDAYSLSLSLPCVTVNEYTGGSATLSPGEYCGGLKIDSADVTLLPGVYKIDGGDLIIDGTAKVRGAGVAFYFMGDVGMTVGRDTTLDLTAPVSGDFAGILMFQNRTAPEIETFEILSNDARQLVGTIYLKRGHLLVDASTPVADQSAYTALIVDRIELKNDANLVLNSNYDDTNVPVPTGLAFDAEIRLRR